MDLSCRHERVARAGRPETEIGTTCLIRLRIRILDYGARGPLR
jgi:hypothetical protein